ncbi:MAG: S8 family serine peptidase [Flavipsychrobacter sp.]
MRKSSILSLICVFVLSVSASAQQQKLSPVTRMFLQDLQIAKQKDVLPAGYVYKKHADGNIYVSGMIKVDNPAQAEAKITALGAQIGTKAGNIWTVQVPYEKMPQFAAITGIGYIQLDEPVQPTLDVARKTTRVDSVHAGYGLPYIFSGAEVVVGVIDFGFDYTHPTFFDTSYNQYRIKKVWEMNGTGTPPAGYSYGRELVGDAIIQAAQSDNVKQTHGTATAGMAAGSGYGSTDNRQLRGMAFNSDIVLVGVRRDSIGGQWMQSGFSDFVDGIKYIFDYAASVNRPAVVNISWGSQSGPHDGTTLMNQACDNLSGSGKIVVMSAGNEGQENIHLSKTFTATDSLISTFPLFNNYGGGPSYKRTWVDVWGDAGKSFCAKVTMYKHGVIGNTTGYVCLDDMIHNDTLIGSSGNDTCFVQFITSSAEFNGKPRITVNVFDKTVDSFFVTVKATDGTIHMWDEYYYYGYDKGYQSDFQTGGEPWATAGNSTSTVSDMGAAQSVLLVGAYCTKVKFTNLQNQNADYSFYYGVNGLAGFSSRGPMIDGRIKPDITAPGVFIATSMSSYNTDYLPGGASEKFLVQKYTSAKDGRTYYFGEFSGTSASGPAASGIVALMLQANPRLTPQQVHDIIATTAIMDSYTHPLPASGDNKWGHGKINAYGAVKMALQQNSIYQFTGNKLNCILYPNPGNGNFMLEYSGNKAEVLTVTVTNVTGGVVASFDWKVNAGNNNHALDISGVAKGVYMVKVGGSDGAVTIKTVVQ